METSDAEKSIKANLERLTEIAENYDGMENKYKPGSFYPQILQGLDCIFHARLALVRHYEKFSPETQRDLTKRINMASRLYGEMREYHHVHGEIFWEAQAERMQKQWSKEEESKSQDKINHD